MIIGSRYRVNNFQTDFPEISLAIGHNDIKRVTSKKSLGFFIDDQLKGVCTLTHNVKKSQKVSRY